MIGTSNKSAFTLVAALAMALALGACAKNPTDADAMNGA